MRDEDPEIVFFLFQDVWNSFEAAVAAALLLTFEGGTERE